MFETYLHHFADTTSLTPQSTHLSRDCNIPPSLDNVSMLRRSHRPHTKNLRETFKKLCQICKIHICNWSKKIAPPLTCNNTYTNTTSSSTHWCHHPPFIVSRIITLYTIQTYRTTKRNTSLIY